MWEQAEQIEVHEPNDQDDPADGPVGRFRNVNDLKAIEPPGYNIDGILQKATTALLWGLPGSTKTTHAVDWWARLALGLPWCGAEVTKGIACYLPLEDLAGFRARVDAWEEYNETSLPPWALWWDGGFDFTDECITAVRQAMEAAQREHNLPVVFSCIDPIMKAYGDGAAVDERDFRKRLLAIENMVAPFKTATAVAIQHAGWEGKHELGSILQRALTATSIRATSNGPIAQLTVIRQKNDEEGRTITFQKHALGDKGKLVMVQDQSGAKISKTGELSQNLSAMLRILSDAGPHGLAVDEWNEAAREIGLAVTQAGNPRRTALYEMRGKLKDRKLVHETNGRWYVTKV